MTLFPRHKGGWAELKQTTPDVKHLSSDENQFKVERQYDLRDANTAARMETGYHVYGNYEGKNRTGNIRAEIEME